MGCSLLLRTRDPCASYYGDKKSFTVQFEVNVPIFLLPSRLPSALARSLEMELSLLADLLPRAFLSNFPSLVPRPVRAIRVTKEDLEPSAIARPRLSPRRFPEDPHHSR